MKAYNVKVKGYSATGNVELADGQVLDLFIDFTVHNASDDLFIDFDGITGWNGSEDVDMDRYIDLDDLADQIVSMGDLGTWEADEIGSRIDSAMDSMEDR